MVKFICNVCGAQCTVADRAEITREAKTCHECGSTARFRWIVHALSTALFGRSLLIEEFPETKTIHGIGMSEWEVLSERLSAKLGFTNTYYHQEPVLDITQPSPSDLERYDFVICSEVFEHIPPPVQPAFENLALLLKPGGLLIFSTPWKPDGTTQEHFPDLYDWACVKLKSGLVLVNRTTDGRLQIYGDLVFHGGPGETLEMRLFARDNLVDHLVKAGLEEIRFARIDESPEFGILFEPWSLGLTARRQLVTSRHHEMPAELRAEELAQAQVSNKVPADELRAAIEELAQATASNQALQARIDAIHASTWWKLAWPLRRAKCLVTDNAL